MRLGIIAFLLNLSIGLSAQSFEYSYVDPCNGNTEKISIPFGANAVAVTYYNQIRSFTESDFQNGVFDQWAQSVYNTYKTTSPCAGIGTATVVTITQATAMTVISIMNSMTTITDAIGSISSLSGTLSSIPMSTVSGSSGGSGGSSSNGSSGKGSSESKSSASSGGFSVGSESIRLTPVPQASGPSGPSMPPSSGAGSSGTSSASNQSSGSGNTGSGSSSSGSTSNGEKGSSSSGTGSSGASGSGNSSESSSQGSGSGGTPKEGSAQEESKGETNLVGGTNEAVKSTPGNGGGSKSAQQNSMKPTIVGSSDLAGFNFRDGGSALGGRINAGFTSVRYDQLRSHGILFDYTSAIKGPNITGFYAWMTPKRVNLLSTTLTIGFEGKGSIYNTIAAGQMRNLSKRFKLVYMGTVSYGSVYDEMFLGTAAIAGGMYDFKVGKRLDIKLMSLAVYSPYVSYYNDILLQSPFVILPTIGTNIAVTKNFRFNVNWGGAWAISQSVLNYTITLGTRLII
jgi:hypothetical protein